MLDDGERSGLERVNTLTFWYDTGLGSCAGRFLGLKREY